MLYCDCKDSELLVVVVVLIFFEHKGLCGRLADSKLFLHRGINTVHKFSSIHNAICVHVTYTVVTVHTVCESLYFDIC